MVDLNFIQIEVYNYIDAVIEFLIHFKKIANDLYREMNITRFKAERQQWPLLYNDWTL